MTDAMPSSKPLVLLRLVREMLSRFDVDRLAKEAANDGVEDAARDLATLARVDEALRAPVETPVVLPKGYARWNMLDHIKTPEDLDAYVKAAIEEAVGDTSKWCPKCGRYCICNAVKTAAVKCSGCGREMDFAHAPECPELFGERK